MGVKVLSKAYSREYWMIDKGPGFLAVVWFGSSPTPSAPSPLCRQKARPATHRKTEKERKGVDHMNHMNIRKPCLYKSFNTLWPTEIYQDSPLKLLLLLCMLSARPGQDLLEIDWTVYTYKAKFPFYILATFIIHDYTFAREWTLHTRTTRQKDTSKRKTNLIKNSAYKN